MSDTQIVTLTPVAWEKARAAVNDDDAVLRMGVRGGGCSGFQYALTIDVAQPDDIRFEQDGLPIAVAADAVPYLTGSVLDYEDDLLQQKAGFRFDNPNATAACGCGSSFRVDGQAGCDAV
jgi:iron-sulfur cluster assembly protein